jgi:hypothetical protein
LSNIEKVSPETRKAIEVLLRVGVPERKIASTLDVPASVVREVTQFKTSQTFSTELNADDQELADGLRRLTWRAMQIAEETLMFGSPQDQQMISRAIVSRSMALIGAEKTSKLDEIREEFHALIGGQSGGEELEYELPVDNDVIDV